MWADNHANDTQPRDADVDRAVARQFGARARQEAVAATRMATSTALATYPRGPPAHRKYAGRYPVLRALIDQLEAQAQQFAAPMPARLLKEAHFASANVARSRDAMGRSLRSR